MNMRRLPFGMLLTVSALAVACGETPPADNAPQPTGQPASTGAPTAAETAAPAMTATAASTAASTAAPATTAAAVTPPAKPGKEKIVGTWTFSFEGEPRAKAEEDLKKKFAKEKDTKKYDAEIRKLEESAAGEWIEFKDGWYISHVTEKGKDKIVLKIKYEVAKDDNAAMSLKPSGKDEISKKELKEEVAVTFKDDDTITMVDPGKKMTLVFKRKK